MVTATALHRFSHKDLTSMARRQGIAKSHAMTKQQLIAALSKLQRPNAVAHSKNGKANSSSGAVSSNGSAKRHAKASLNGAASKNGAVSKNGTAGKNGAVSKNGKPESHVKSTTKSDNKVVAKPKTPIKIAKPIPPKPRSPQLERRLAAIRQKNLGFKDIATPLGIGSKRAPIRDRLVAMVRDPYWLHAYWELTRQGIDRARAAMGQDWHLAKPILRLFEVSTGGTASAVATPVRDIEIHGGVCNWYVDVPDPPQSYRLEIGYAAPEDKFFSIARSNVVTTPRPGSRDSIDEHWSPVAENCEKILAQSGGNAPDVPSMELQELLEERLSRPMGSPINNRFGPGLDGLIPRKQEFKFDIDAEMILFGTTEPTAHVTLQNEPVKLREDGTFAVRMALPNCRQVIPIVACSRDGIEQRTIVLAVERNTKSMEPVTRETGE